MSELRFAGWWIVATLTLTCGFGLATCLRAQAQATSAQSAAAAETLFRAGRTALAEHDYATAAAKFYESYRLDPAPGTLLNLAVCEEAQGQLSVAWQHYQEIVHSLAPNDDRQELAHQHLQAIEARLPRVTFTLEPGAPADSRLFIGGLELGSASYDVALPLDPGSYDVEVRAEGHDARSYHLDVHEGDRTALSLAPGAPAKPVLPAAGGAAAPAVPVAAPATSTPAASSALAQPSAASSAQPEAKPRVLAYVLLGAGAASLIAGVVTTALTLDRAAIVREHCDQGTNACDPTGQKAADQGTRFFYASIATFSVAAIAGGIGTYLLLRKPTRTPMKDAVPAQARLTLTPALTPSAAYLGANVTF